MFTCFQSSAGILLHLQSTLLIYWTSFSKYVTTVYNCRMNHWPFCSPKVGMFLFFPVANVPDDHILPFVCTEYVSAFVYCSSTDCPSTEEATSTQMGMLILINHAFVLPSGIWILDFHMLFNSSSYFFCFLSYNLWPIVGCLLGWCVHYYVPWHHSSQLMGIILHHSRLVVLELVH